MSATAGQPVSMPRHVSGWVTVPLGIVTTALLCLDGIAIDAIGAPRLILLGCVLSGVIGLLLSANALNRAAARTLHNAMAQLRDRQLLAPVGSRSIPGPRPVALWWRYTPAVLAAGLGVTTTIMLQIDSSGLAVIPLPPSPLLVCVSIALLWTVVLASTVNARHARRLSIELLATQMSEQITVETLGSVPVLHSFCMPDGNRSAFNRRYLELTGSDESALAGRGWLECIHEHDRARFETLFLQQPDQQAPPAEIEYGMTDAQGGNRYIHEHLVPCWSDGQFAGYVATGIDITDQVKNETEHQKTIERLRNEMESQLGETRRESADLSERLEKLERNRDRLQRKYDTAQQVASEAKEKIATARQQLKESRTDLKLLTTEHQETKTENRRLNQSLQKNEKLVKTLESEQGALREENEHLEEQLGNMRESAELARRQESQLRAKVSRLTDRCQELEQEIDEARAERDSVREEMAGMSAEADERAAAGNADLARELRPQLQAVLGASQRLHGNGLGEAELRALDDARASVAAMSALVDGALGGAERGKGKRKSKASTPTEPQTRTCDVREAVESVTALLEPACADRGVKLRTVVAGDFPTRVIADPVRIRETLMHLAGNAVRLVDDDTLTIALEEEASTPTHVAARFEIRHDTARFETDELEERFAVRTDPAEIDDPAADPDRYRAAIGWRLVGSMSGEFGIEPMPKGGFRLWFTLTLPKPERETPAASAAPPPPVPAAAPTAAPTTAPVDPVITPPASTAAGMSPVYAPKSPAPTSHGSAEPPPTVPRLPLEYLKCNLGEVHELGCDGMRVSCTRSHDGTVTVEIPDGDAKLEITGNVESSERQGRRKFDVVLRFMDVMPQTRQRILQVAMAHRRRSVLPINSIDID